MFFAIMQFISYLMHRCCTRSICCIFYPSIFEFPCNYRKIGNPAVSRNRNNEFNYSVRGSRSCIQRAESSRRPHLASRLLQFVGNGVRSFNVVLPGRVLHTMNSISARWGDYVAIERCPCSPCHRREFNIISKNKGPLHETPIAPPVDENEVTLDRGVLHKYLSFNIAGYRVIFGRTT